MFRVWGYTAAVASGVTGYCLGLFSPTPLIATLGISFFGLGKDMRHAVLIPALAISVYFVQCVLVVMNVIPDYGLFNSGTQQPGLLFFFTFMVPIVLMCTLWMARLSRQALERAVESAAEAHKLVDQREAQLQEAELELEHALIAGAGIAGRYTGRLAGRYELGVVIGRGGMGEVYSAKAIDTKEECAVKLLRDDVVYDDATYQRFLREGEIGESLKVPNAIRIYDVGRLADGAGSQGFPVLCCTRPSPGWPCALAARREGAPTRNPPPRCAGNAQRGRCDTPPRSGCHRGPA